MAPYVEYIKAGSGETWPVRDAEARIEIDEMRTDMEAGVMMTYTQSGSGLTGSGTVGKFKATTTGTYTAFSISGTSYSVRNNDESNIELISGNWYMFILDATNNTINFKSGGGLTKSKLELATATEADVLVGKTFYGGDKELKTGLYNIADNISTGYMYNSGSSRYYLQPFSNTDFVSDITTISGYMGVTATINADGKYKIAMSSFSAENTIKFSATFTVGDVYSESSTSAYSHMAVTDEIELSAGTAITMATGAAASSGNPYGFMITVVKIS